MRYLDPRADMTFYMVFGKHPDLMISFLNAMLPLKGAEEEVTGVEYLPLTLVPDSPMREYSVVVVRCKDRRGRQFIVEIQTVWSPKFKRMVTLNARGACVRGFNKGKRYELPLPTYSLNLSNYILEPELQTYCHRYRTVKMEDTGDIIEGMEIILVELPKFKSGMSCEKRMQKLWLRFLTEIDEKTRNVPQELLDSPEIKKAVEQIEEAAFTDAQLRGYDKFWDMVSVEKTLYVNAERKFKKWFSEGRAEGKAEGRAEGMVEANINTARRLKQLGVPIETIMAGTGLSEEEVGQA